MRIFRIECNNGAGIINSIGFRDVCEVKNFVKVLYQNTPATHVYVDEVLDDGRTIFQSDLSL